MRPGEPAVNDPSTARSSEERGVVRAEGRFAGGTAGGTGQAHSPVAFVAPPIRSVEGPLARAAFQFSTGRGCQAERRSGHAGDLGERDEVRPVSSFSMRRRCVPGPTLTANPPVPRVPGSVSCQPADTYGTAVRIRSAIRWSRSSGGRSPAHNRLIALFAERRAGFAGTSPMPPTVRRSGAGVHPAGRDGQNPRRCGMARAGRLLSS
jgi:hypothetical protein